jgi:membrane protein implicated in regulation of membrane protease activity
VNPALKYFLGRVGLFLVVAVPVVLLLPRSMNPLLKLMIALVVSAVLSYFVLRRWRDEVAERMSDNARRRREERDQLRSALAGDDDAEPSNRRDSEEDTERP